MGVSVRFHSSKKGEINKFLSKFYNTNLDLDNKLILKKEYVNPIEITEIIGVFIDNIDDFEIKMWISLDKDVFINITPNNANIIIKYLFERYPY